MIGEHRRIYRLSLALVLAAAALFLFYDRTVSLGLLLGAALYYVYLLVLTKTVTAQLSAAIGNKRPFPAGFAVRVIVLASPLLIAARFPQHFNLFAAFAPLFINHFLTYILYARGERAV